MEEWKPEEVTAHLDYYRALHRELVDSGELVESEVLAPPNLAKIVTSDGAPRPWSRTGRSRSSRSGSPATRSSTSSRRSGRSRSRAKISAVPGPGGVRPSSRFSVRQVMTTAPSNVAEMEAFLEQVGGER